MAKANTEEKNKAAEETMNVGAAAFEALLRESGAVELSLDRRIYNADACKDAPLKGFVVDLLDMPPITVAGKERPWQAFLFLVTHDTQGLDREGNLTKVKAGEEIIIPATWQIHGALRRFVGDIEKMHEVLLVPIKKLEIGGGQTMWTYRLADCKKSQARGPLYISTYGKKALISAEAEARALGVGSSFNAGAITNSQTGEVAGSLVGGQA